MVNMTLLIPHPLPKTVHFVRFIMISNFFFFFLMSPSVNVCETRNLTLKYGNCIISDSVIYALLKIILTWLTLSKLRNSSYRYCAGS